MGKLKLVQPGKLSLSLCCGHTAPGSEYVKKHFPSEVCPRGCCALFNLLKLVYIFTFCFHRKNCALTLQSPSTASHLVHNPGSVARVTLCVQRVNSRTDSSRRSSTLYFLRINSQDKNSPQHSRWEGFSKVHALSTKKKFKKLLQVWVGLEVEHLSFPGAAPVCSCDSRHECPLSLPEPRFEGCFAQSPYEEVSASYDFFFCEMAEPKEGGCFYKLRVVPWCRRESPQACSFHELFSLSPWIGNLVTNHFINIFLRHESLS